VFDKSKTIFYDTFYFSQRFKNKNSSLQYTVATHNLKLYYNCISYDFNQQAVINSRYGSIFLTRQQKSAEHRSINEWKSLLCGSKSGILFTA